ncbi:MAG: dTDP-4-dehydrorhamnose reductase [Chloroflexi bacterium]|nr:dTDP-4-dehydrorhamnose reductase [Chloroflexota bacterium]
MRILITGANGQLGRALQAALSDHHVIPVAHDTLDVGADYSVDAIVALFPELVIHAAAMTNVDACERNPDEAYRVNALGAKHIAQACAELNAPLVYVGTDYIFDGLKGEPYLETDAANPISVYGRTKLEGENFARALVPKHYIVRTSWVYARGRNNFVTKILALAAERPRLNVVNTEFSSPTYAPDLAQAIAALVRHPQYGTYHLSNEGVTSRFDYARAILDEAGQANYPLDPASDYPRSAKPPPYSALRNTRAAALGVTLRPWRQALHECLHP